MKKKTREELTEEIISATTATDTELEDLDRTLEEATEMYHKASGNEFFVRMRYEKFKGLLEKRRLQLFPPEDLEPAANEAPEQESVDEESKVSVEDDEDCNTEDQPSAEAPMAVIEPLNLPPEERQEAIEKLEKQEAELEKVRETHLSLEMNCKALKTRIQLLQQKKGSMANLKEECNEFLVAAAVVEGKEEAARAQEEEIVSTKKDYNSGIEIIDMEEGNAVVENMEEVQYQQQIRKDEAKAEEQ